MKVFRKQSITQKIIATVIVVILLFNLILPTYSKADDGFGGQLWEPVQSLVLGLGDVIFNILQKTFIEGAPEAVFKCTMAEFINGEGLGTDFMNFFTGLPIFFGDFFSWLASVGANIGGNENADTEGDGQVSTEEAQTYFSKDIVFPSIFYSVENIFANKIPAFDVNFINPSVNPPTVVDNAADIREKVTGLSSDEVSSTEAIGNIASQLQSAIANWYNALRILSLVAMLSILVYIGIRITLVSTSAKEQAKYKVMLKDWVFAIVILFVMHYIMVLGLTITQKLTEIFYTSYVEALNVQTLSNNLSQITAQTMATSIRLAVSTSSLELGEAMGYTIMYAVFVVYTLMFTWQYLKRVIYMAFLTMIAPLVAITYPIDKMKDGKAQAFNMWMKEYIFNLLIQPIHLMLFTVLVLSATDLMKNNVIYAIVAIGFLTQSIKIVKKLFGFDRPPVGGGGLAEGIAGGAMFSAMLGALQHIPGLGRSKGATSSGGSSSGESNNKINFAAGSDRGSDLKGLAAFRDGDVNVDEYTDNLNLVNSRNSRRIRRREALTNYQKAGHSKNDAGYYYNPHTKEYDPNYDPTKDEKFNINMGKDENTGSGYKSPKIDVGKTNLSNKGKDVKAYVDANNTKGRNKNNTSTGNTPIAGENNAEGNVSQNANVNLQNVNSDEDRQTKQKEKSNRSVIRGFTELGKRYVPKAGMGIAKLTAGALAAGTLGTIGVAAGLASDKSTDAIKLGITGITAGAVLGSSVPGAVIGTGKTTVESTKNVKETYLKGYHGEKYEEVKADKAYKKSKDVDNHLKLKFGDKWNDAKEKALELRKLGITDQKDIDIAIKIMFKHEELSIEEVVSLLKFKDVVTRAELRDKKKRERIRQKILSMGIDEKQADVILSLLDEILDT